MALSADKIAELYANKRTKGLYVEKLTELMESDEPGVDPAEEWPMDFGKKNPTTLYQGFRNAAETLKIEDKVDVVQREGSVFILVKERCEVVVAEVAAAA